MKIKELEEGWYRVKSPRMNSIALAFLALIVLIAFPTWSWLVGGEIELWLFVLICAAGMVAFIAMIRDGVSTLDLHPHFWKSRSGVLGIPKTFKIKNLPTKPLKVETFFVRGQTYFYLVNATASEKIWIDHTSNKEQITNITKWLELHFT